MKNTKQKKIEKPSFKKGKPANQHKAVKNPYNKPTIVVDESQQLHNQPNEGQLHQFTVLKEIIEQKQINEQQFKRWFVSKEMTLLIVRAAHYYKLFFPQNTTTTTIRIICGSISVNGLTFEDSYSHNMESNSVLFKAIQSSTISLTKSNAATQTLLEKISNTLIGEVQTLNKEQLQEWLTSHFDGSTQILTLVTKEARIQLSTPEWKDLPLLYSQHQSSIVMVGGNKNTGKSTLCDYLFSINPNKTVIMDVDIGKNKISPGCISLITKEKSYSLWIGELSPVSNIESYINAIVHLFQIYGENYFDRNLIVNTMGYLTGIGEILFYQTFNLVKPKIVLLLEQPNARKSLYRVKQTLQTGSYLERLYFSKPQQPSFTTTKIKFYENIHAGTKNTPPRFQNSILSNKYLRGIDELLMLIFNSDTMSKVKEQIPLYLHRKSGQKIPILDKQQINMRLLILGTLIQNGKLFQFSGFGFGWQGGIYYDANKVILAEESIGGAMISEGIDFDRSFYQLSQKAMVMLELDLDKQIPYLEFIVSGLGSKGTRNLPSRKAMLND